MLKEFKEFIAKGNVLDLAIGIIIGAAFGTIVDSFVKNIINPIIGLAGKANFDNMFLVLKDPNPVAGGYTTIDAAQKAGAVTLNYGAFLTNVINFLILGFIVFLIVKAANKMKKKQEVAPEVVATPQDVVLLSEIRDLLAAKR
jgi:large conductance mechanosensitive channel